VRVAPRLPRMGQGQGQPEGVLPFPPVICLLSNLNTEIFFPTNDLGGYADNMRSFCQIVNNGRFWQDISHQSLLLRHLRMEPIEDWLVFRIAI
jgi:hypothetical protein